MKPNIRMRLILLLTIWISGTSAFIPNTIREYAAISITSQTHMEMITEAHQKVAVKFMSDYPDIYPDQEEAMATDDFKQACDDFRTGVEFPDIDDDLKDNPLAHFDNEKIKETNTRIKGIRKDIFTQAGDKAFSEARKTAGQILHTIQDFYSHTNWIEMGRTSPHPGLAVSDDVGRVAGAEEPTCDNCGIDILETVLDEFTYDCPDNIKSSINNNNVLTSGYAEISLLAFTGIPLPQSVKPVGKGKCSHGGKLDVTRNYDAKGGINKDSNSDDYSPHHYLHPAAAKTAVAATVLFLEGLRETMEEKDYAKLLGLEFGASLCFVVDTTGSMAGEISAVIATTVRITETSVASSFEPSDFVLVPFNDPGYGPAFVTDSAEAFKTRLRGLRASGGGDTPELAYSGIRLALLNVRQGSSMFVFTDAPAKDTYLASSVLALAIDKSVKVYVIRSYSKRRKKRTLARQRVKRQIGSDPLTDLAYSTGGQVIDSSKADIEEITNIVDVGIATIQVNILLGINVEHVSGGQVTFEIPVDVTMTDLIIQVSSGTGSVTGVEIIDPSGSVQTPGTADSGAPVIVVTDTSGLKLYRVASPAAGLWLAKISANSLFSISAMANSLVDFSYKFVELVPGLHGGYVAIPGKPLAGNDTIMIVDIFGGYSSVTGDKVTSGLAEVTGLSFVSENGTELASMDPFQLKELSIYQAEAILPEVGFRVVLTGKDTSGNKVQRLSTSVVTTSASSIRITADSEEGLTLIPGEPKNVSIIITNTGDNTTYRITISDSADYFQGISADTMELATGETKKVIATFLAPDDARLGVVSSVSVTATNSAGDDQNFIVFRLSTSSKTLDVTPPECTITSTVGSCEQTKSGSSRCEDEEWSLEFTTKDSGLGLYTVKPATVVSQAAFFIDDYIKGTTDSVSGNFSSNCCWPNISIVSTDALGNSGRCDIVHIPLSTPAPPVTVTPTPVPAEGSEGLLSVIVSASIAGAIILAIIIMLLVINRNDLPRPKGFPDPSYSPRPYVNSLSGMRPYSSFAKMPLSRPPSIYDPVGLRPGYPNYGYQ